MAWTYLDATYRSEVCNDADCNGHRMPGIARNMGFASLGWIPEQGWYAGADVRYMSDIMADDENTAKAPSYTVAGVNTGYKFSYGNWMMDIFGRIDNLFDREYVGSVIVNESNGRYYEPAPGPQLRCRLVSGLSVRVMRESGSPVDGLTSVRGYKA